MSRRWDSLKTSEKREHSCSSSAIGVFLRKNTTKQKKHKNTQSNHATIYCDIKRINKNMGNIRTFHSKIKDMHQTNRLEDTATTWTALTVIWVNPLNEASRPKAKVEFTLDFWIAIIPLAVQSQESFWHTTVSGWVYQFSSGLTGCFFCLSLPVSVW